MTRVKAISSTCVRRERSGSPNQHGPCEGRQLWYGPLEEVLGILVTFRDPQSAPLSNFFIDLLRPAQTSIGVGLSS